MIASALCFGLAAAIAVAMAGPAAAVMVGALTAAGVLFALCVIQQMIRQGPRR